MGGVEGDALNNLQGKGQGNNRLPDGQGPEQSVIKSSSITNPSSLPVKNDPGCYEKVRLIKRYRADAAGLRFWDTPCSGGKISIEIHKAREAELFAGEVSDGHGYHFGKGKCTTNDGFGQDFRFEGDKEGNSLSCGKPGKRKKTGLDGVAFLLPFISREGIPQSKDSFPQGPFFSG